MILIVLSVVYRDVLGYHVRVRLNGTRSLNIPLLRRYTSLALN